MSDVTLVGLDVSDPPGRWEELGFSVGPAGGFVVGSVRVMLGIAPPGRGIVGWSLAGAVGPGTAAGLPTRVRTDDASSPVAVRAVHPNGAVAVDHVVVTVPDLDAFAAGGLAPRRRAEIRGRRMGFRRLGGPILELVEDRDAAAPSFWGLTFAVAETAQLDELAGSVPSVGDPRPAVQPGRRIATVGADAALSTRIAFIDPE